MGSFVLLFVSKQVIQTGILILSRSIPCLSIFILECIDRPRLDLNSNESYRKHVTLHGGPRGLHLDKVRIGANSLRKHVHAIYKEFLQLKKEMKMKISMEKQFFFF